MIGADQAAAGRRTWTARRWALALVAAAAAGIAIGIGARLVLAPAPAVRAPGLPKLHGQATWPAGARPAPDFALRDQHGQVVSLASLRGRPLAMTFFDSHCHEQCPLMGRALAAAERSLPAAERPVTVVVSINPLDTPKSARAAARHWGLARAGDWHWFMGTHAQLRRVWAAYHIWVHPADGDIQHTEALYLIDRHGDERSGFLFPFLPNFVTLDLRSLARERA